MAGYGLVRTAAGQADLVVVARHMFSLMLRNVASDGFVFTDPDDPTRFSVPGCVIASPSYARNSLLVTQNYVYNWTRDAAVTAIEIAAAIDLIGDPYGLASLDDYVTFAAACQQSAPTLARACFAIDAQPRDWTDQNDGPALQSLAIMSCFAQLQPATQDTARQVVQRNSDFLLQNYRQPSFNLWEETKGQSFFTRSVQRRCLSQIKSNTIDIVVPPDVDDAISWLDTALAAHWDGVSYLSILDPENPRAGYDPNIDVVMAAAYGAVSCADTKVLATAAQLRRLWSDPSQDSAYPINAIDADADLGPLLGRYHGDSYDGDDDASGTSHPWALCTANFAQLYYDLAADIVHTAEIPYDALSAPFFAQLGIDDTSTITSAQQLLVAAGDRMLRAVVHHSDHLELSEQFDADTGYEKSVRNLTWSYAAFLSAVRARSVTRPPVLSGPPSPDTSHRPRRAG